MTIGELHELASITRREQLLRASGSGYDASMAELPDKLRAITAAAGFFAAEGVLYALIGGVAVGIRSGVPRATLDVNFAALTTADFAQLNARIVQYGFAVTGRFAHSINYKHASGEPVQLAFDRAFDPMIERAEPMRFGSLELRVVTKEDLIAMKRLAAADPRRRRSKALRDQADIAMLEGDVPDANEGW